MLVCSFNVLENIKMREANTPQYITFYNENDNFSVSLFYFAVATCHMTVKHMKCGDCNGVTFLFIGFQFFKKCV